MWAIVIALVIGLSSTCSAQYATMWGTGRVIFGSTSVVYEKNGASFDFMDLGMGKNRTFTELFVSVPISRGFTITYDGLLRNNNSGNINITGEMVVESVVFGKRAQQATSANAGSTIEIDMDVMSNAVQLELPYIAPYMRPLLRVEGFEANLHAKGNAGTGKNGATEANKKFRTTDFGVGLSLTQHSPRTTVYGSATYLMGSSNGWDADLGVAYFLQSWRGAFGAGYRFKSIKTGDLTFKLQGPYLELSAWF